jgi:hypothetical protein
MMSCYVPPTNRRESGEYFAVPAQNLADGTVTGIKIFREMLELMREGDGAGKPVAMMPFMRDVGRALTEEATPGRRPAATTLVWLMADALESFAKRADFQPWLAAQQANAESYAARYAELVAYDKAEFVARMKKGKAAKAAKAGQAVTP